MPQSDVGAYLESDYRIEDYSYYFDLVDLKDGTHMLFYETARFPTASVNRFYAQRISADKSGWQKIGPKIELDQSGKGSSGEYMTNRTRFVALPNTNRLVAYSEGYPDGYYGTLGLGDVPHTVYLLEYHESSIRLVDKDLVHTVIPVGPYYQFENWQMEEIFLISSTNAGNAKLSVANYQASYGTIPGSHTRVGQYVGHVEVSGSTITCTNFQQVTAEADDESARYYSRIGVGKYVLAGYFDTSGTDPVLHWRCVDPTDGSTVDDVVIEAFDGANMTYDNYSGPGKGIALNATTAFISTTYNVYENDGTDDDPDYNRYYRGLVYTIDVSSTGQLTANVAADVSSWPLNLEADSMRPDYTGPSPFTDEDRVSLLAAGLRATPPWTIDDSTKVLITAFEGYTVISPTMVAITWPRQNNGSSAPEVDDDAEYVIFYWDVEGQFLYSFQTMHGGRAPYSPPDNPYDSTGLYVDSTFQSFTVKNSDGTVLVPMAEVWNGPAYGYDDSQELIWLGVSTRDTLDGQFVATRARIYGQ